MDNMLKLEDNYISPQDAQTCLKQALFEAAMSSTHNSDINAKELVEQVIQQLLLTTEGTLLTEKE